MNGGCRRTVVGYWSWRDSTYGSKAATHYRMTLSGKADTVGRPSIVDAALSCSQLELTNFLRAP